MAPIEAGRSVLASITISTMTMAPQGHEIIRVNRPARMTLGKSPSSPPLATVMTNTDLPPAPYSDGSTPISPRFPSIKLSSQLSLRSTDRAALTRRLHIVQLQHDDDRPWLAGMRHGRASSLGRSRLSSPLARSRMYPADPRTIDLFDSA